MHLLSSYYMTVTVFSVLKTISVFTCMQRKSLYSHLSDDKTDKANSLSHSYLVAKLELNPTSYFEYKFFALHFVISKSLEEGWKEPQS